MKRSILKRITLATACLAGLWGSSPLQAQSTTFSGSYAQNFDLALTNSGTVLPPGYTSMAIAGGNTTYEQGTPINAAGIASAAADTQALLLWNAGTPAARSGTQSYNIGCWDSLNDRALGTDPTGTAAQVIQLSMTNTTGGTLYGVTFSYDCKCLTNGSAGTEESELPGYCFFYSTTGTTTAANWTEVGVAGTAALVNGVPTQNGLCLPNFTQGTTMSSGPVTIQFATPLPANGVMYFRWADDNNVASSPDQMLAIDNINIQTYTPSGPVVSLTAPASGATFTPGSNIPLAATASETGGTITNVAFYAGSTLLGQVTTAPYSLTWPGMAIGSYTLTAVASDAVGITTTSAVVNVTVSYQPPTVSLTSPVGGTNYSAPASILLTATAADSDGTVTNVAFYAGSTLLANVATAPYTYTWANISAGSYLLTAKATDNNGLTGTSSSVSVTVANPTVAMFTGVYTQNFDLALSNNTTAEPPGFTALVIAGSHDTYVAATPIDAAGIASATPDTQPLVVWNFGSAVTDSGSQNFNIGCSDSLNDRALGTDPTGTAAQVVQLALTNTTGGTLYGVTFSYDCKCLTNGSAGSELGELPGYCFFYSLTGSTLAADWNEVGAAGNVPGATNSAGLPVADGLCLPNYTQGTTMSSGPVNITFPAPLPNGGVMFFRWADDNNINDSPDAMYAIDNISITSYSVAGPVVSISSPTNTENIIPGTGVTISASATDSTTNITSVGLYIDGSLAYTFTSAPYILPVPGGEIPAGSYTIYAIATDATGLMATSSVVNVTIAYVAPTVSLTSPTAGTAFAAFSTIPLAATAAVATGESTATITNVAFYAGATLLANVNSSPFDYSWADVSAGTYALTALATDSHGLTATSSVVSITVTNGFGISLTSPANGSTNLPGASIALAATAFDSSGTITNVEFYANGTDLGGSTTAPYGLTWPNVAAGVYALTAVASDASGLTATSSVVNLTIAAVHLPPVVSLTSPANNAVLDVSTGLVLSASASSSDGTVTNVAFYLNSFLVANVASAPYIYTWTNAPSGIYTLTAVATDNTGASTTSSAVSITASNSVQIATLQQIKTVFIIPLENHDLVQANPTGSPEQILGNPAAPYFNSLITPGNSNAVQTAYATHMFSCAINGEHPSEPNYVWSEAGTDFGIRTDNDPAAGNNQWSNVQHLSGQLTTAGILWHDYQEDVQYSSSELVSASGSGVPVNPYNGTTEYYYAVKHNPMAFFTDTQNKNIYPMTNLWTDLTNNTVGRYNWVTPDQYNEMHSSLPSGFTYNGTAWTGDQAAIAEGDNALSIIIPKIMASQAYKDHGVIIIWTDETESTDDTNTTLPYIIISSLTKGNAYASTLPYSHSSDLKTMDELFGLAYQTNAIPGYLDAQNTGINYVNGSSAIIYDLSDFFTPANTSVPAPALGIQQNGSILTNGVSTAAFGSANLGTSVTNTFTVTNTGSAALVLSNIMIAGANAGDFTASGLTLPASVAASASASFSVVFIPTLGAVETATLSISDNDTNNNPFTLALSGTGVLVPPTVSLTAPATGASFAAPAGLTLTAASSDIDGTVTSVAFYQGTTLLGNATSAPFSFTTANLFAGSYTFTAVATDNNGLSSTSGVVSVIVTNTLALQTLQSIKTIFVIAMENHDLVQKNPTGSPEQILGNPAAPYFNSLITPGNPNAAQTAWATHMFSCAINGEHPSEPNYVWQEAGTDFGIRTDNDPSGASHNIFTNVIHLSGQLTAAGISWRSYQEDVQYSTAPTVSASGSGKPVNIYNGTTDYNYAAKHNPMEFFPDTQNLNCYPMTNFWTDLTNHNIGRYNWITPDQYNEWHSSLPGGYTYKGVAYTGDQAAIAEGDNCLSIIIPQIMASAAYQDHGVIIIWTDETESTDDTNTTLPYVIISPLAKGNAYASTLPYSHTSDLKTMDEIFGLAWQTNGLPSSAYLDAQNTGYNYVNNSSAPIYDLSDFFAPGGVKVNGAVMANTNGGFQMSFFGPANQTYEVLATTDLTLPQSAWMVVGSGTFGSTNVVFTDSNSASYPGRYYVVKSP